MKFDKQIFLNTIWVCLQTFSGQLHSGIFYSWGSLVIAINDEIMPGYDGTFSSNHGLFVGILILFISVSFMLPLRLFIDTKTCSEFSIQFFGTFLATAGLCLGSVAIRYHQIWLLYLGCALPCGIGGLFMYQRLIFNHQYWFKSIELHNIGSGIFGFAIGMWTVVFFLVSVPLLQATTASNALLAYAALIALSMALPVFTIDDDAITRLAEGRDRHHDSTQILPTENDKIKSIEAQTHLEAQSQLNYSSDFKKNIASMSETGTTPCNHTRSSNIPSSRRSLPMTIESPGGHKRDVDSDGHYALTYTEILQSPQTYILIAFFMCVITPGWGIKLAAYSILQSLFRVSTSQASGAAALYVSFYALGRLFSGLVAEYLGVFVTYDILISTSACLLVGLPFSYNKLPHDQIDSSGYSVFLTLLTLLGLCYGGAIALFYSIVFDIFGRRNYRAAFAVTVTGFGLAVIVGGVSSGYSFSSDTTQPALVMTRNSTKLGSANGTYPDTSKSDVWFWSMAGACAAGFALMHCLRPYDYSLQLKKPHQGYHPTTTENDIDLVHEEHKIGDINIIKA